MGNFSKKLQDSTEDELNFIINELDARYGVLASNELLKRTVKKLEQTITILNRETSEQTEKMLFLTYTTTFFTVVMVIGLIIQIYLALLR